MKWKLLVGSLLSVLFLFLAFRGARLDDVAHALADAEYIWIIPVLVLTVLAFALRAWRWRLLLEPVKRIGFLPLFSSTMIGFMGNNLLPARLGELMRAHSLGRSSDVSRSAALATIVVERIFDIIVLLIVFGLILLSSSVEGEIRAWGLLLFVLAIPVLALLMAFRRWPGPVTRLALAAAPGRLRPTVGRMADNFREGLAVFSRAGLLLRALLFSLAMWACFVLVVELCFRGLGLDLPRGAALVVLVVMAIGTMVPSAPGYIGTLQYAGTLALLQYGVERSVGLSFTFLYHASQWFPVTAIGLFFFARENLSLRALARLDSTDRPKEPIGRREETR